MRNPKDRENERGNKRPRKQARILTREPEREDYGDDSEAEFAVSKESIALTQPCTLRLKRGEPVAIDAPRV